MAKKAEVVITCDASTVKRVLEGINNEIEKTKKRREELERKQAANIRLTKQEEKELEGLIKYENALADRQQKATGEMRKFGEVMQDLAGSKTKDLKRALNEGKRALDNMSAKDKNRQKLIDDLRLIQRQIDKNTASMKNFGATHNSVWSTAVRNIGAYMGVFAAFNKVKSMVENVFKANLKLSDSLADIRKVSGLTMKDINQLYGNISKIDTRNTIETLNQLAYTGAKLGIAEHGGTQALTGFVKAAEQVQMALGEDLGEEALPALAKLTEVMGLMDRYGVEQAMQKSASAIFQLGATSTATGKNIVEFSKRLMGLANVSRISADELLAIGSASDAMGLMPEVAATAFNKLFTAVQQKHNLIEKTLDLPKGRINYWFEQGKTMNAIVEIFDAMNKRGNMNALDGVFKDLGSDGARLVAVMTTMADRVDILKKHLETSTKAFKEGDAVIGEYMIQNETAAALMERASNMWAKAFTNPEGVTMVQQMAKEWYNLSKEMTNNKNTMAGLKLTLDGIALALRTIIQLAPFLIKAFTWAGVLATIRGIYFGISSLITAIRTATTAAATLQVVLKSNWVLAGVSAVAAAFTMIYEKSRAAAWATEEAKKQQAELDAQMAKSKETIEQATRPLERYKSSLDKANVSEAERNKLLKEYLAGNYQEYLDYLGIEINKTLDLAKAYNMVVKTMKQKKAYEERESYRDTVNGQNRMDRIAAGMEFEREAKRFGLEGIDRQWIAKNQQGTTMDIYMQLMRKRYGGNVKMFNWDQLKDVTQVRRGRKTKLGPTVLYGDALGDVDLWNAIVKYQNSYRTERNINRDVDDMFKDMVGDYDPDKWEKAILEAQLKRKGGLTKEKPDKAAIAAAKKAAQEAKQAARKELKDAETETNAIIAKVEEWYTLQQNVITDAYNNGEITQQQMTNINQQLEAVKNQALSAARRSLSGQDTGMWEIFKENMGSMMLDQGEWSKELLQSIIETDMDALRNALMKFDGKASLDKWGFTSTAFRDSLNKNAAKNEAKVKQIAARFTKQAEAMVEQFQFLDVAVEKLQNDLEQMGFITETVEQMARRIQMGYSTPEQYRKAQSTQGMVDAFNSRNTLGSAAPEDMGQWLRELTDNGNAEWAKVLPELQKWVRDTDKYKDQINNLYELLRQMQQGEAAGMKGAVQQSRQEISQAVGNVTTNKQYFEQASMKFIGQGTIPYTIDITNQREALEWLRQFATDAKGNLEEWAQAFPMIADWVKRIKEAEKDGTLGEADLESMKEAMPQIQALYYQLMNYADGISANIKRQVEQMTSRTPIGIDEMRQQYEQRRAMTEQLYNEEIQKVGEGTQAAVELEQQKNQALIDLDKQWLEQKYQIQEELNTTVFEQQEHELAQYKNMLDKKLISERQFQQKRTQLQMRNGLDMAQRYNSMMAGLIDALQEYEIAAVDAKYDVLISQAKENGQETSALETEQENEKLEIQKEYADLRFAVKASEIIADTSVAVMKAFAELGPYAGAIAGAIISAQGTLQLALALKERERVKSLRPKSATSVSSSSSNMATKTKLANGMLTYDEGNADSVLDGSAAKKKRRYLGNDGRVYLAEETPAPKDGLVTRPIATTVQGQPALVAERGPEIVIGRETTEAIMMNEPELIRYIANYDRMGGKYGLQAMRAYDSGNAGKMADGGDKMADVGGSPLDADTLAALRMLPTVMNALTEQLKKPVYINKYGTGGLIEEVKSGLKFDERYNG